MIGGGATFTSQCCFAGRGSSSTTTPTSFITGSAASFALLLRWLFLPSTKPADLASLITKPTVTAPNAQSKIAPPMTAATMITVVLFQTEPLLGSFDKLKGVGAVGAAEGAAEGVAEGAAEGALVGGGGVGVGPGVGVTDGAGLGGTDSPDVGPGTGTTVGAGTGSIDGSGIGAVVDTGDGGAVGARDGAKLGAGTGSAVGGSTHTEIEQKLDLQSASRMHAISLSH